MYLIHGRRINLPPEQSQVSRQVSMPVSARPSMFGTMNERHFGPTNRATMLSTRMHSDGFVINSVHYVLLTLSSHNR